MSRSLTTMSAAVAAVSVLITALAPAASAQPSPHVADPRIAAHFDVSSGQQPENITLADNGSVDVTMSHARQVVRVTPDGRTHVLGTVPAPPAGTTVPLTGSAFVSGLVHGPDGALYFLYSAGTADLTGLWRLCPGEAPRRIAALPADGVPNGLALFGGFFYATDSAKATVWRIPFTGGAATAWSTGPALATKPGLFGANGIKVHNGSVWVTNLGEGTLLRIPLGSHGTAQVVASGLGPVDDFAFVGADDTILAAVNPASQVLRIRPDGTHEVVLSAADGLQNPTAVAIRGRQVYVTDSAYFTGTDPNLLIARLDR
jgi:streptogramin lyase